MAKSNKFGEMKDVLDRLMRKTDLFFDFKVQRLYGKWKEIVGEQLFDHTKPDKIYKETLIVLCDHQGWITTLQFHKKDILNKIYNIFGAEYKNIVDIKFIYKIKRS